MGSTFWPKEDEEMLANLVSQGFSGGQIADRMSACGRRYSRNAIIGKVFRMRLRMARKPSSTVGITRAKYSRGPRSAVRGPTVAPVAVSLPVTVEQPKPEVRACASPRRRSAPPPPRFHGQSLVEQIVGLRDRDCRWPVGTVGDADFHFCGEERHGHGPYCDYHSDKARPHG